MRPRLGDLWAGLVLLVLALGCFARLAAHPGALIVDGGRPSLDHAQREDVRVAGNDLTYLFLPHYSQVAAQLARSGRLPLWDSWGFAGRPMVGNPQAGLFYPPVWLTFSFRAPSALGWLTVAHLVWAGLGTYLLLRSQGLSRVAATFAGGCFEASPYLLGQTFEGHYPHIWAVCWYPWAFRAFVQLRAGRARGGVVLAPILALAFLTGHPQEWYYLVFVLTVWVLADAFVAARAGRWRTAVVALTVWTGLLALGLGLVAVELIPDIAAQGWTLRSGRLSLGKTSHYDLNPFNLFQLLGPFALGGPADYFGRCNYWESLLSIGLIPLILAAIAVAWHPNRRLVTGWLFLVIGAIVFAAGHRLGLFNLLFALVPGMNRFRVPSRSLFLATLGAAVLAGFGLDTLADRAFARADWLRLASRMRRIGGVVFLGLLVLDGFGTEAEPISDHPLTTVRVYRPIRPSHLGDRAGNRGALAAARLLGDGTFWFAVTGTIVAIGWGCRRPDERRLAAFALGLFGLLELGQYGYTVLKVASPERFLGRDPISRALAAAQRPFEGPYRIRARDVLYSDLRAFSNRIEKVNINDSFQIQHAADLYQTLYPLLYVASPPRPDEMMGEAIARFRHDVRQGVLDRMNVAFLVSDHIEPELAWPLVASGTWGRSRYAIHCNPTATPRAYVVPRAEPTSDEASLMLARFRHSDPRQAVLMPIDPLGASGPRQPYTPAEWRVNEPERIVLQVATRAPGLLVIADTWMPGWKAVVNGRPTPILRGNHAQRVVPLGSAGEHEIVLTYRAPGLVAGACITIASIVAWAAISVVFPRIEARRRQELEGRPDSAGSKRAPREGAVEA